MCIHNETIDIHNSSMAINNWNKYMHNWNINSHNWIWMSITELCIPITELLSHPVYRECLYGFVPVRTRHCRRRRQPQTLVHAITSEQLFGFLLFLIGLMTLTGRLDYLIRFWSIFVVTLSFNWIFKVKYGICYNSATNDSIATKRKSNILFVLQALKVTMRFDLGHGLDLKFSRPNMKFAIYQIRSDCHEMKSKRFDWILSSKCSHRVWHWLWYFPWIFKVKFWNNRISGIGGPIDIEQPRVFHDRDRDVLVTKMSVRSYSIMTRVTSDVGVPSTRPVDIHNWRIYSHLAFHTKSIRNR